LGVMLRRTTVHGDWPSVSDRVAFLVGATTLPSASSVGSIAPPLAAAALALAPGSIVTIFGLLDEGDSAAIGVVVPEAGVGVAAGVDPDPLAWAFRRRILLSALS
jgi:hypothetical protein